MQIRVTKVRAEDTGPQNNGKLLNVTWLLEVWPNLVPTTGPTIISREITFAYFKHDSQEQLDRQDEQINAYLAEQAESLIKTYLNEKALITEEPRIDNAASTLKTTLEAEYGSD